MPKFAKTGSIHSPDDTDSAADDAMHAVQHDTPLPSSPATRITMDWLTLPDFSCDSRDRPKLWWCGVWLSLPHLTLYSLKKLSWKKPEGDNPWWQKVDNELLSLLKITATMWLQTTLVSTEHLWFSGTNRKQQSSKVQQPARGLQDPGKKTDIQKLKSRRMIMYSERNKEFAIPAGCILQPFGGWTGTKKRVELTWWSYLLEWWSHIKSWRWRFKDLQDGLKEWSLSTVAQWNPKQLWWMSVMTLNRNCSWNLSSVIS